MGAMMVTDRIQDEQHRHAADAARRYQEVTAQRERVEEEQAAGVRFPDTPQALAVRAERILDRGAVPPAAVVAGIRAEPMDLPQAYERIIGLASELQAASFLPRGVRAAATVARIGLRRNGRELPLGTGFLVSDRLMLTNHHVLPDAEFADGCFAEFNAQVTVDNVPDTACGRSSMRPRSSPPTSGWTMRWSPLPRPTTAARPAQCSAGTGSVRVWASW
ncbi:hypothetical protein ACF1G3_37510 [Streptomyces rochei]|uniref:hypothetical protein n=1 Tax=Streptomyces rochei TaxID=1928 RepID=UPI0036FE64DB